MLETSRASAWHDTLHPPHFPSLGVNVSALPPPGAVRQSVPSPYIVDVTFTAHQSRA